MQLAKEAAATKVLPLRTKKLYLIAALENDRFRKKALSAEMAGATTAQGATRTKAAQTLDAMVSQWVSWRSTTFPPSSQPLMALRLATPDGWWMDLSQRPFQQTLGGTQRQRGPSP